MLGEKCKIGKNIKTDLFSSFKFPAQKMAELLEKVRISDTLLSKIKVLRPLIITFLDMRIPFSFSDKHILF